MGKVEFSLKGSWCAAQWPHSRRRERASKKTGYGFYKITEGLLCDLDTNAQLPPASSDGFFWSHYKDMLVYFYNILKVENFYFGCVQFYGWWFFQWKSIDKSSFHVWWCGPLSFFVHYMKSSFEELLRDLQIISKELFLSSWNLVSTTNLNTAFIKSPLPGSTRKISAGGEAARQEFVPAGKGRLYHKKMVDAFFLAAPKE